MTYGTHRGAALLLGIGGAAALHARGWGVTEVVLLVVATALGGVWPDVDTPHAAASRRHLFLRLLWCLGPGWLALSARRFQGHRALSHSLLGVMVSTAFVSGLLWWTGRYLPGEIAGRLPGTAVMASLFAAGFAAGQLLHVGMDACTESGVPLWLPVTTRRVHLVAAPFRTRMDTAHFQERGGR